MPLENDVQKVKFEKWRYYCNILENAKHIVAELQDDDVYNERMEAFRVYNNSFIALLKHKYPYSLVRIDDTCQVVLEINKEKFYCDIKILKKQLKKELFELIEYDETQILEGTVDEETDFIIKDLKSYKSNNSKEKTNGPPNNENESVVSIEETPSYKDIPKDIVEYKRMVLSSPIVFAKATPITKEGDVTSTNPKEIDFQAKEKSPPIEPQKKPLEVHDVDFEFLPPKKDTNINLEKVNKIVEEKNRNEQSGIKQSDDFVLTETNALLNDDASSMPKSTSIDIGEDMDYEDSDIFDMRNEVRNVTLKTKEESLTIQSLKPLEIESDEVETENLPSDKIINTEDDMDDGFKILDTIESTVDEEDDLEIFDDFEDIIEEEIDETANSFEKMDLRENKDIADVDNDFKERDASENKEFHREELEELEIEEHSKVPKDTSFSTDLSVSYISDKNEILNKQLFYDYHKIMIRDAELKQNKEVELWVYPKDIVQENTVSADIIVLSKFDDKYKAFISPEVGRKSIIVEYDKYELLVRASWKDGVFESSVFPSGNMMSDKIDIEKECVTQRPTDKQLFSHLILNVEGIRTHILPGTFNNTDNGMADILVFTDEDPRQIVIPIASNVLDITLNGVRKNVIAYWEDNNLICDFQTRDG